MTVSRWVSVGVRRGTSGLDEQASTLRETRDRAGSLMSTAVVAGGLAAGLAFDADRVAGIDAPGTIGAAAAVARIRPGRRHDSDDLAPDLGKFVHDAGVIIGSYVEGDRPP